MSDRLLEKKAKRINKIIDSAEKIFFKKGYENTALKDVAADLDLVKGTIYIYFSSKEELFAAIVLRSQRKLVNLLQSQNGSTAKLIETYSDFIRYNKHHFKAILSFSFIKNEAVNNSLIDEIEENNSVIRSIFSKALSNSKSRMSSEILSSIITRSFDATVIDNVELDELTKELILLAELVEKS
jgi:AcrR family transcriptional regulator